MQTCAVSWLGSCRSLDRLCIRCVRQNHYCKICAWLDEPEDCRCPSLTLTGEGSAPMITAGLYGIDTIRKGDTSTPCRTKVPTPHLAPASAAHH
eukprot:scaffold405042_cov17-Prasinocladus_malaysianus.AAC.1